MKKCNFTYISEESELETYLNKDQPSEVSFEKAYHHIWMPPAWSTDKASHSLDDINDLFHDQFIFYHEQLKNFHNMYVSIIDADRKEEENNQNIFDIVTNNYTNEEKVEFIKRKRIFHNADHDTLQNIEFFISDPTYRLDTSDKSYFRDSAFYTLFSAFIQSVLKDFVHALQGHNLEKTEKFIRKVEKELRLEHKRDYPKYIILATCIDRICRMEEINNFLDTDEYKLFNKVRNERAHDLLMKQYIKSKFTICDCFYLTKKLLTKLSTCKKLNKTLNDLHPVRII